LGEDSYELQVWDNGNSVECHGQRVINGVSDTTVFEYDCDGGGYVAITNLGAKFREYRASDGWSIEPELTDYNKDTQLSGTYWMSLFEASYKGGDCSKCPTTELCGWMPFCKDFDGTCSS
jgi:hypothetical protein